MAELAEEGWRMGEASPRGILLHLLVLPWRWLLQQAGRQQSLRCHRDMLRGLLLRWCLLHYHQRWLLRLRWCLLHYHQRLAASSPRI